MIRMARLWARSHLLELIHDDWLRFEGSLGDSGLIISAT